MKVCVIGLWHLGSVTSACLANFGHDVVGFDPDKEIIENLNEAKAPIFEPGLDEMIKTNIERKQLFFTSNIGKAISGAEYVLLTMDTPVDDKDMVDLASINQIMHEIILHISNKTTIIVQSQVPVGTCNEFIDMIKQKRKNLEFGLAYCPENLRLGKAIEIFTKPDRIIIGSDDKEVTQKIVSFFNFLDCPKITMDLKSAEMTKHSINAFLATCISFINFVGNTCEKVGADAKKVSEGLMTDQRIGSSLPLRPGLGFSGGTLGRDVRILEKLENDLDFKSTLMRSILTINHEQNILIIKKLLKIFVTLEGLQIGILGLTYKASTSTLRRSTSLEIINELLNHKTKINAYDPSILKVDSLKDKNFELHNSAYDAAKGTSALLVFTDWPEFRDLNYEKILQSMKRPIIFDMKNFLDEDKLKSIGFDYRKLN